MAVIVSVLVILIYLACPLLGKVALLVVNMVVPDPIPFVDEFIMWVGLLHNLLKVTKIALFIREHKLLCFIIFAFVIICIFAII